MISLVEEHFYASDTELQTRYKIKCHGFIQFYQVTKHKKKIKGSLFTQEECGGVAVAVCLSPDRDAKEWELIVEGFNCSVPC